MMNWMNGAGGFMWFGWIFWLVLLGVIVWAVVTIVNKSQWKTQNIPAGESPI